MVLRLVLVSIVAGLGVSPPAEGELAGWTRTIQTWLDSRLAEWDAQAPPRVVAPAPVAEANEGELGLDAVINELLAELKQQAPASDPAPIEAPGVDADRAFDAVVDEMVAEFSKDNAGSRVIVDEPPAPEAGAIAARGEVVEDAPAPAADALSEAIERETKAAVNFEEDLYPGLAYDLNQEADGISDPVSPAVDAPSPIADVRPEGQVPSENGLKTAVRLTRDAMFAWMNLLQSPAIMTISR